MFSWLGFQSLSRPIFLEERRYRKLTGRYGWRWHQVEQLDVLIHILGPCLVSLQSHIQDYQQFNESIDISSSSLDDIEAKFPLNVLKGGSCSVRGFDQPIDRQYKTFVNFTTTLHFM
jgi:hypothetical protein